MRERAGVESGPRARTSSGLRRCASVRVSEWRGPDLNRRHRDFQSRALPAELPRQRASSIPAGRGPEPADGARELLRNSSIFANSSRQAGPAACGRRGWYRPPRVARRSRHRASVAARGDHDAADRKRVGDAHRTSGGLRSACGRSGCRAARTHAGLIRGHAQRRHAKETPAATRTPVENRMTSIPPRPIRLLLLVVLALAVSATAALGAPTNRPDPGQAGGGPGGTGADRAAG